MTYRALTSTLMLCLFLCLPCQAAEWNQFLGSTGQGVSGEKNLPTQWNSTQGIRWSIPLAGQSNSSPAVTSKRIDLTTQKKDQSLWIISIDRKTGKLLRETRVGQGNLVAKGPANLYAHRHNAATPSPIADETHTWAFFGNGLLVCLEAKTGQVVWQRDMVKDYGAYDITFGMGSSPRMWGDLLYVSCMTKGVSYVVALDKNTGKQTWKTERKLPAKDDGPDAYSTPSIFQHNQHSALLISGSDHVTAYDLKNGKQIWVSSGLDIASPYGRIIASPVSAAGVVIATSANPGGGGLGHVMALGTDGHGDVTQSQRLWKLSKTTPDSSTPVCYQGNVYLVTDKGIATCLDLKSGKQHWQKRLPQGPYHASLVAGDDRVYFLSTDGTCSVVSSKEDGKVLSTNKLEGTFYATPAISGGIVYLRAYERLYAIGK
ncbi:MAG: PQQ-binding-like beta-propeller repeat protein [Planctomycetaceae bacterium]|nr:PQQ-binding-like beta-propeller repeat protein [Planctomycetaceae bacterium]